MIQGHNSLEWTFLNFWIGDHWQTSNLRGNHCAAFTSNFLIKSPNWMIWYGRSVSHCDYVSADHNLEINRGLISLREGSFLGFLEYPLSTLRYHKVSYNSNVLGTPFYELLVVQVRNTSVGQHYFLEALLLTDDSTWWNNGFYPFISLPICLFFVVVVFFFQANRPDSHPPHYRSTLKRGQQKPFPKVSWKHQRRKKKSCACFRSGRTQRRTLLCTLIYIYREREQGIEKEKVKKKRL